EGESVEWLHRGDRHGVHQRSASHPDVGETIILRRGNAHIAKNRLRVLQPAVEKVDAEKTVCPGLNVQIGSRNILDERATTGPALDVNRVGLGLLEGAMLDAYIANTTGGLAAHADTGKNVVGERTIADQHIFRGTPFADGFHAATGLDRDAVVTRLNIAAFN